VEFTFKVTAQVERTEGKFSSREDIGGQIAAELESADPGSIQGENDGQYEVTSWEVEEEEQPKRPRRRKAG
jgi:hypothetical protein